LRFKPVIQPAIPFPQSEAIGISHGEKLYREFGLLDSELASRFKPGHASKSV